MAVRSPPPSAWKPGQSGNPAGRKPGTQTQVTKLRESLEPLIPTAIEALTKKIEEGDAVAIRVLLDRSIPPLRAIDLPVEVKLPDDSLTAQDVAILKAMSRGVVSIDQAAKLLTALSAQARIVEVDELERRVAALEEAHAKEH